MNVILKAIIGQPAISRRGFTFSQHLRAAALALSLLASPSRAETHWNLQAVTASGASAWMPSYPLTVVGVLLTDPDEMLDATVNFQPASAGTMGGEWQIVVQAAWPGDRGGTTCWIGQNYALRHPPGDDSFSYGNEAWLTEVARLNQDPATGHAFHKGDLVSVTANGSLFFGGKRNINEQHHNEPEYDFTISLVASNYGLPAPEVLSLASLMRTNDNNAATSEDIFDETRATSGEHWQGVRVRLNGLTLLSTNGWNPTSLWGNRLCSVTDGENRFFTLRHPLQPRSRADLCLRCDRRSQPGKRLRRAGHQRLRTIRPGNCAVTSIGHQHCHRTRYHLAGLAGELPVAVHQYRRRAGPLAAGDQHAGAG